MADGVLTSLLVIHGKTVDDAVWEDGWRDWQDFLSRSNDSSYVTRPIFKECVKEAVLKYFNARREMIHLDDFAGILHCDN
jgi:hypothetical protein